MRTTKTAEKLLRALEGVFSSNQMASLVAEGESIARVRGSSQLGFRHLITALERMGRWKAFR